MIFSSHTSIRGVQAKNMFSESCWQFCNERSYEWSHQKMINITFLCTSLFIINNVHISHWTIHNAHFTVHNTSCLSVTCWVWTSQYCAVYTWAPDGLQTWWRNLTTSLIMMTVRGRRESPCWMVTLYPGSATLSLLRRSVTLSVDMKASGKSLDHQETLSRVAVMMTSRQRRSVQDTATRYFKFSSWKRPAQHQTGCSQNLPDWPVGRAGGYRDRPGPKYYNDHVVRVIRGKTHHNVRHQHGEGSKELHYHMAPRFHLNYFLSWASIFYFLILHNTFCYFSEHSVYTFEQVSLVKLVLLYVF